MATKAGVWIDHKQATVVLVTGANQEFKKIAFDIGQPVRSSGGARSTHSYTPRDFVAEDHLERKVENDRKDYYDDVIAALRGAAAILIVGPGEAKGEFNKHIKRKKLRGLTVELETTDKMTDRQLAAKVREHFAKGPAQESSVPKKARKPTGPKKAANGSLRKRAKKTGK